MKVTIEGSGSIKLSYSKLIKTGQRVIDETTKLLKYFTSYEVACMGREGNKVAHKLAIHAKFVKDMRVCGIKCQILLDNKFLSIL